MQVRNQLNSIDDRKQLIIENRDFEILPQEGIKAFTIVIKKDLYNELLFLKSISGFTFSFLTFLCFQK
ncbi:hypothetical protein ACLIA0_06460 [Bacillaceae bacterium W0354]